MLNAVKKGKIINNKSPENRPTLKQLSGATFCTFAASLITLKL